MQQMTSHETNSEIFKIEKNNSYENKISIICDDITPHRKCMIHNLALFEYKNEFRNSNGIANIFVTLI